MSPVLLVLVVVLGAALVVASGLLAAAETAFTRVSRTRADAIAAAEAEDHIDDDEADARVEELRAYTRRPATVLASLELVQLVTQAGAMVCGWMIGNELAGRWGAMVGVVVAVAALFAGMVVFRSRALAAPDTSAVGLVPILRAVAPLGALTSVMVRMARRSQSTIEPDPDVDEQELLAIVGQTAAIDHDEEALIKRAFAFDDRTVGEVMTPRGDIVSLRSGFAVQDALQVAALHGLSRIPVTAADGDIDELIGTVLVKDLWVAHLDGRAEVDIDLWLRDLSVVPEQQRVAQLLADLQRSDMHLAVVVDEHGGVAGLITLEDILEELVGEIEDEYDQPEPDPVYVDRYALVLDGRYELSRARELLGLDLVAPEARTIAGAVFNGLGRVPVVGDSHVLDESGVELRVRRMHGRRIADVEVRSPVPIPSPEPGDTKDSR